MENNNKNKGPNKNRQGWGIILFTTLVVTFVVMGLYSMMQGGSASEISYDKFLKLVDNGKVESVTFTNSRINIVLTDDARKEKAEGKLTEVKDNEKASADQSDSSDSKESEDQENVMDSLLGQISQMQGSSKSKEPDYYTGNVSDDTLVKRLDKAGVEFKSQIPDTASSLIMDIFITVILPIVLLVFMFNFLMKKMSKGGGMMGIGKSNAKMYMEKQTGVTFLDVAGEDEAKESLQEVVDFLHNPGKYTGIGAKLPKGALLVGPPGTGKTLLAKAVAGEAKVPFFSLSGSAFVEMYVGVGASRVRDLFKQAQQMAPCIVFIDEIDAIGKSRDSALGGGGNDEREQTLNQLLTEMDGFDGSKGVVILAATNRPDSLDPALLRPGRFDRRIPVELPDLKGREEILKVHAKKIKIADSVRFDEIAKAAAGASGAELANIVNEAALRAVRDGRKFATQADFEESIEVVIAGYQKKNRVLSNKEKLIVAYHEIGHALVAAKQTESAPVHKITIIPRTSGALGYTMQVDDGDHYLMTKEELANKIATFTGGRAAEELIFHSITTGASNDIEQATKLARAMISRYGMSEDFDMVAMENVTNQYLGGDSSLSCSFETQTLLDKKVVELVRMEHQKALKILQDNIGKLHELAKYLYEHETITGEEFMKILNTPVQVPTVVAESESNTESENNAESENSTEADADTSSGKVNLQK